MKEDPEVPEIPKVESQVDVKDEETTKKEKQLVDSLQSFTHKIKETVNLDLFLPDIHLWILDKIREGPTLIIGDNITDFASKIVEQVPSIIARETSSSYVRPKGRPKKGSILTRIDFKSFQLDKIASIQESFLNIIIIFTLRKLSREQQLELMIICKRKLSREGQLIVVGEFYPKSALLYPITFVKEGFNAFKSTILKRKVDKPISKLDKIAEELDLKFFDVKYDAGGRIRTYVLTKRWGTLIN